MKEELQKMFSSTSMTLQVIGGNITVVQGSTAFFPCILKDTTEKLNQISWQKKTKKNPEKINFFTILPEGPEFFNVHGERFTSAANFNEKNGSFRLSNVTLMDQGTYTCIFTLFPSGNHQTEIPLNVLVPPVISVKSDIPTLGDKEVSLATCTASGSLPPAQVNWVFGNLNLKITTNSSVNDDGTTTTISTLWGVPTIELDHRSVQCVVTSEALSTQKSQPFTIQIHFPPTEVNVQEKSSGVFECISNGNPEVQYTWNRSDHLWPHPAVKTDGSLLHILRMTSELNGVFTCEASNSYGKKQAQLYMQVTSEQRKVQGACHACWTLFSLSFILLGLLLGGAAFLYYKFGSFLRTEDSRCAVRKRVSSSEAEGTPAEAEL
ncbi:nectin-4-like isoform X2 [Sphaeramia orbicularis]|uniref:nectin-4-like isoform X2 n=1 Tax=Sphaeramia orbicularis TaxID=375764 RepID=UPI00117C4AD2|nr:nectin-4-like isoform X2 [Sphaeramia orbicularis]